MKIEALVKRAAGTRNIVGLLKDVDGLKSIAFNSVNLQNTDTLVFVDLLLQDGSEHRVFCSKEVSKMLRSKEITKEVLLGFPIVPYDITDKDGATVTAYYVQRPDGASHKMVFDVSTLTVKDYVPAAIPWNELIG